jgi:hypothetical protein
MFNRSATCEQTIWKVHKKSIHVFHMFVTHDSRETHNMCVRNVTIPVLIQHFSNVTIRYVVLFNRSATCDLLLNGTY